METTVNRIALKALLLDTITHLKFGHHLNKGYKVTKNEVCLALGQRTNINSTQLLHGIGLIYKDNKIENEFWSVIDKFDAQKYLN